MASFFKHLSSVFSSHCTMNKSMILMLMVGMLALVGCTQGNVELDNAGEESLRAIIDELPYQMSGGTFQRISLEPGLHSLVVQDMQGEIKGETTFQVTEGGLINLAKKPYYIWVDLYGDTTLRSTQLKEDWVTIGNESFYGQFEPVDTAVYYVERRWDYGLDESFPNDLYGWKITQEKWIIKRKLFRQEGLVKSYKAMF